MKKAGMALIILALLSAGTAFAGDSDRAGWMGPFSSDLLSKLKLSDNQESEIQALRGKVIEKVSPLRSSLFQIKGELKDLWVQNKPDEGRIKEKQKQIRLIRDQIKDRITNYSLELKKLLTPEQNSQLAALWLEWGKGMGKGKSSMKDP
jgi:Spy/CpxP family protein refolding chaperone